MLLSITATSGRHTRSCDGAMEIHHPTTPRNITRNTTGMCRLCDSQSAQIEKAANAPASPSRNPLHGKFE